MSNMTSGGEECYRERQHSWGYGSWGEQVPSLQPNLHAPLGSPLSCLTLDSVRTQTVYKEGVHAS